MLLLTSLQHTNSQGLTFTTNTFPISSGPHCVAATDVNGDGKLDLISADYGYSGYGNTLTVMTNNGSGILGSNATLTVGGQPRSVVVLDVNGDGKPDLVCGNAGYPGSVMILTNDASGHFQISSEIVGIHPESIQTGDLNGDRKMAFVCVEINSGLTVFTNDGTGNFCTNASFPVGGLSSCAMADINGDGKLDLITSNIRGILATNFSLTIFTNNANGSFGSNSIYFVNTHLPSYFPLSVVATDINGDGKPDLIAGGPFATILTILTNNVSGIFGSNATLSASNGPIFIVTGDFNGDGKTDLGSANYDGTMTFWTNNGSGVFGFNTNENLGSGPWCAIAADLNGNGKLDLISANMNDGTLTVLLNASAFPPPSNAPVLTMNLQSNNLSVTWPKDSPGWSLLENSDLMESNWLPSGYGGYPITDNGTNKNLTLPILNGNRFFRLIHP